ncbi:MAG: pyridoxal phosphate-dependent aminotransferase [Actinobacteria bacterium]|nr:pyridoxal phosphate-dependent aminotransferase [Cyanobacteriota bacterium]MCL5770857.1 pyridoxal phosphate-dependent aminotransferase [Actinomycetota bacterium]
MSDFNLNMNDLLSKKVLMLEESPTFALEKKADEIDMQLKKEGNSVIRFGIGQPDFNTPINIKDAAKRAIDENKTRYTSSTGIIELKKAIVNKFNNENNIKYDIENVFAGNGAKQVLDVIIRTFINTGDIVIIPKPYWVSYTQQVLLSEGKPVTVNFNSDLKIDINDLNEVIKVNKNKIKLLILNSPNNPTGAVYSKKELEDIGDICLKNNIYIISDEVYEHFIYDNIKHFSIASLSDELKKLTITVNAVSKTYAMTGWRIGYCAADKDIIKQMAKIQDQSASNPCTPAQWAAVEALNGNQDSVEIMRKEYEKRRDYIYKRLSNIGGISCNLPHGAFYVFPDISALFNDKIKNSFNFAEQLLEKAKVAVVPGGAFGDDNYIRISYATTIEKIEEGMNRLEKFCKEL